MRPLETWLRWRRLSLIERLDRLELRFIRTDLNLVRVNDQLRLLKARRRETPFRRR